MHLRCWPPPMGDPCFVVWAVSIAVVWGGIAASCCVRPGRLCFGASQRHCTSGFNTHPDCGPHLAAFRAVHNKQPGTVLRSVRNCFAQEIGCLRCQAHGLLCRIVEAACQGLCAAATACQGLWSGVGLEPLSPPRSCHSVHTVYLPRVVHSACSWKQVVRQRPLQASGHICVLAHHSTFNVIYVFFQSVFVGLTGACLHM